MRDADLPNSYHQLRELISNVENQRLAHQPNAASINIATDGWLGIVSRCTEVCEHVADLQKRYDKAIDGEVAANGRLGDVRVYLEGLDWPWLHQADADQRRHNEEHISDISQRRYDAIDLLTSLLEVGRAAGLAETDIGANVQRTYIARLVFNVPVTIEHGRAERHTDTGIAQEITATAIARIAEGAVEPTPITQIIDPTVDDTEDIPF